MASASKTNSVREILNRGILISFCLSLLVCGSVLVAWQIVSKAKTQAFNVNLVRTALERDASDLITSSMLKNYDAVAFQLKAALTSLPIQCAFINLNKQTYSLKGDLASCTQVAQSKSASYREEISSGGIVIGPLVYVLEAQPFRSESLLYFLCGFVGLVASVMLTWGVLVKMINDAILKPLRSLTSELHEKDFVPNQGTACDEVVSLSEQLRDFRSQVSLSAKREEYIRVARMVAHNIRTPVLVLEGISTKGMDDASQRHLRSAVTDIKDLIHDLRSESGLIKENESALAKLAQAAIAANPVHQPGSGSASDVTAEHLMDLIEMVISEKRLQGHLMPQIEFTVGENGYQAFAKIQRTDFKCILFNLLNNAIDALGNTEDGKVTVNLSASLGMTIVTVADNGPGIPAELLPRLGERGVTSGKAAGSGLGLYHAKTTLANWGGNLRIISPPNKGTSLILDIPRTAAPEWFVEEISIQPDGQIIVLDVDAGGL